MEGLMTIESESLFMRVTRDLSGKGRVNFLIRVTRDDRFSGRMSLPGSRLMRRLACKFLSVQPGEYQEISRTDNELRVSLPIGTKTEDRAAFLGAVRHHCIWQYP
jgi:hypothetical protein